MNRRTKRAAVIPFFRRGVNPRIKRAVALSSGGKVSDDRCVSAASELVAAANLNCAGSYRKLAHHCTGGAVHDFGTAVAFATGVPIALFNGCLAFGATARDANLAIDWLLGTELPYLLWTDSEERSSELGELARERGLSQEPWALPGMVLARPPEPPASIAGIKLEQIDGSSHERWLAIIADNGMPIDMAEQLFPLAFVVDPEVAVFAAYLDGLPVGTSIAIRTGDVSGVYAVTTAPDARRHGVGTAAAWAAVNAGREWGCDVVTLQASEMGFSSYVRMGFETVTHYQTFARSD